MQRSVARTCCSSARRAAAAVVSCSTPRSARSSLPRGTVVLLHRHVFRSVRVRASGCSPRPARTYEARDRVMALYAPIALLALPTRLVARRVHRRFTVHLRRARERRLARARSPRAARRCSRSASSGRRHLPAVFARVRGGGDRARAARARHRVPPDDLQRVLAPRGRRHRPLRSAAGTPPTPREMLERAHLTGFLHEMDRVLGAVDDVVHRGAGDAHVVRRRSSFFRSPNPHRSWVTAVGRGARRRCAAPGGARHPVDAGRRVCASAPAISRCARSRGSSASTTTTNPRPTIRSAITREEFDEVYERLGATRRAGARRTATRRGATSAGWRVNYDGVLIALAAFVMAPYAPWMSDRSPLTPLLRRYAGAASSAASRSQAGRRSAATRGTGRPR